MSIRPNTFAPSSLDSSGITLGKSETDDRLGRRPHRMFDSGTYSGTYSTGITIIAPEATITNSAQIHGLAGTGGAISNAPGGKGGVAVMVSGPSTVTNFGTLTGGKGGASGYGQHGGAGGIGMLFGNGGNSGGVGTLIAGGVIAGGSGGNGGMGSDKSKDTVNGGDGGLGALGVQLTGASSVSNSGTITGGDGGNGGNGGSYSTPALATPLFGNGGNGGNGGAGLKFNNGGTLDNAGKILGGDGGNGGNAGLLFGNGGAGGAGVILGGFGTLSNTGTIAGGKGGASGYNQHAGDGGIGIMFAAGGTLVAGGVIAGGSGGNGGMGSGKSKDTINGGNGGLGALGVQLTSASSGSNTGTIRGGDGGAGGDGVSYSTPALATPLFGNGGKGGNGGAGIKLNNGGTFENAGMILGGDGGNGGNGGAGGVGGNTGISGAGGAGLIFGGIGTLSNTGTIAGGHGNMGAIQGNAGLGVVLNAGGSVQNGGPGLSAALIEGFYGVKIAGGPGTVHNYGTISGTQNAIYGHSVSVMFKSTGSVLVAEAGSALTGGSAIGNGGTLELGAGGGIGTISGLGSGTITGSTVGTFAGFATYGIETGSDWTLTGANTIAAGHTLDVDGRLTVDKSLTLKGALTGMGTLAGTGTLTIGHNGTLTRMPVLSVAKLAISGAGTTVTVDKTMNFAGDFSEGAGAVLAITSGHVLKLTKSATLSGTVSGPGTLSFAFGNQSLNTGAKLTVGRWTIFGGAETTVNENLTYAGAFAAYSGSMLNVAAGRTLTLGGAVTGTGTIGIRDGAKLKATGTVAGTLKVIFRAATGTLAFTNAKGFAARIVSFAKGDRIDIADPAFAYSNAETIKFVENKSNTQGTLTVTNGANSQSLILFGQYVASGFHLASDGHGGSLITYTSNALTAQPHLAPAGH